MSSVRLRVRVLSVLIVRVLIDVFSEIEGMGTICVES